jgi:hypothetical protein
VRDTTKEVKMPIKNLTEPERQRLPRLGKLRTGWKDPDRGFPVAADYFLPGETTAQELVDAFAERFGDKPTVIEPVYLPTENDEQFASTYYRYYTASHGLVCKGDGETANRLVDRDDYDNEGIPSPARHDSKRTARVSIGCPCSLLDEGRCKALMMLQLIIPDLPGVGIWQIDTGSVNSIHNILGSVQAIRAITGGRISGVPLQLRLTKKEVTPDGTTKKRVNVLELAVASGLGAVQAAALAGTSIAGVLPSPDAELPEADDEIPDSSIIPSPEEVQLARGEEDRRAQRVSEDQLKALKALREAAGYDFKLVAEYITSRFGISNASDMTVGIYEDTTAWLQEQIATVTPRSLGLEEIPFSVSPLDAEQEMESEEEGLVEQVVDALVSDFVEQLVMDEPKS